MKIYIAGPMRGRPDWNFAAFDAAAERWRAAGYQPFSPAAVDRALGYSEVHGCPPEQLRHVIQMDLACVLAADAVALLPGWEASKGSAVELALAQFLGLPVYDALTMKRIHPLNQPWSHTSRHCS